MATIRFSEFSAKNNFCPNMSPSCGIFCSGFFADIEFTEDDILARMVNTLRGLENKGKCVTFI